MPVISRILAKQVSGKVGSENNEHRHFFREKKIRTKKKKTCLPAFLQVSGAEEEANEMHLGR